MAPTAPTTEAPGPAWSPSADPGNLMSGSRLPVAPGDAHVKAFVRLGWEERRTEGSHRILTKAGERATLSIPCRRGQDLRRGTLGSLIRAAGLTVDDYLRAFNG